MQVIRQYERAVIQRLGRLRWSAVGPGIVFRIPILDRFVCEASLKRPFFYCLTTANANLQTRIDLRTKLTQITINEVDKWRERRF